MRRFGLIGKTLKHSFSQHYFTQKFQQLQIADCIYENFELQSVLQLPQLIESHPDLCGLNVTIPYKEDILPFVEVLHQDVKEIGACNCIRIHNGKLNGFNTDHIGFWQSLSQHLALHHQKALVLGSGGASKAVQFALRQNNILFEVVSSSGKGNLIYADLSKDIIQSHLLIINTTPLGMSPNIDTAPELPYQFLTGDHILYDLVYNPAKTRFLEKGELQGARIINGYDMLVLQAEESWRIWNQD